MFSLISDTPLTEGLITEHIRTLIGHHVATSLHESCVPLHVSQSTHTYV
jgi:hypothetical protein